MHACISGPPAGHASSQSLQELLSKVGEGAEEQVMEGAFTRVLQSTQQVPLEDVPNTGVPPELEQRLSAVFVEQFQNADSQYGTRSQTVVAVWRSGLAVVQERLRAPDGEMQHSREAFQIHLHS